MDNRLTVIYNRVYGFLKRLSKVRDSISAIRVFIIPT
jgi:hypothetical protein